MADKPTIIVEDESGKVLCSFTDKKLTKALGKLARGTRIKFFCDEGKDFGKQFIGDYNTKALPDSPTPPDTNKPPVVNAGEDVTKKPGEEVAMDGSAIDTDGTIQIIHWRQISPLVPQVELHSDTADLTNVTFTAPQLPEGQHSQVFEFLLEAFDDKNAKGNDTIKVTVSDGQTPPPNPNPTGTLWTSESWNNGHPRIVKGVATDPDDNQYEMRAGADVQGKKELEIDGAGTAKQTGERYRQYFWNEPGHTGSQGGSE